jgi:hypothetical protein
MVRIVLGIVVGTSGRKGYGWDLLKGHGYLRNPNNGMSRRSGGGRKSNP